MTGQTKSTKRRVATTAPRLNTAEAAPAAVEPAEVDAHEWDNRRASAQATRAANARQVSGRRRFVDPTTCEREYTTAEMEFMHAMHAYKKRSGRMFPTWSEVLEVLRELGYEKPGAARSAALEALANVPTSQTA